jgi:hypothetical protein
MLVSEESYSPRRADAARRQDPFLLDAVEGDIRGFEVRQC